MCTDCEKSVPNQIVFDRIESIIRQMQDEANGLPVKTAKSFMSKIPSVFTGTDLIQWMMKNLKFDDQQEALHLANLIASHGYIFPIEDHTLSIKNDCTFYRFQTPCLWPSNNLDPENTDYAVYLCKRTMQGKARLELADYEAENLARLQKMFSRKWEFIFMQAESQAKVDKKRDKLERKVLDSQERAFWDVYRPVPGCVNTTELDIKKACRLSKTAKRCGRCQKISNPTDITPSNPSIEIASQEPIQSMPITNPIEGLEEPEAQKTPIKESSPIEDGTGSDQKQSSNPIQDEKSQLKGDTSVEVTASPKINFHESASQPKVTDLEINPIKETNQSQNDAHHRSPEHSNIQASHHQHHHHHHHPHGHAHGHHHHHHHHHHHQHSRHCPHHKHQQQLHHHHHHHHHHQQLQIPQKSNDTISEQAGSGENSKQIMTHRLERRLDSKKRSVGSVDQFIKPPGSSTRRKSECNRVVSMAELDPATKSSDKNTRLQTKETSDRPASACCQLVSSTNTQANNQELDDKLNGSQRSVSSSKSEKQQSIYRKNSLNICNRPSGENDTLGVIGSSLVPMRKGSVHLGHHHHHHHQHHHQQQQQQQQHQKQQQQFEGTQSNLNATEGSNLDLVNVATSNLAATTSVQIADSNDDTTRQNINDLERELEALKIRLDRRIGGVKMSKVTQSYLSYFSQWAEYDPFIAQPIPSNPWVSDSTELWDLERQTKDVHSRRVRRWAFSLKELLNDPAGREQFYRFLEKEFSAENLKFWDAVQELKRVHSRDVARRVEAIWTEYLAPDANCPINIDSKSYETSKKNMAKNKNNRYIFDEAAGHVYQLMKNDSYPRYLRSEMYKEYKDSSERKRANQVAFDVFKPQITTLKHRFNF